MNRYSLFGYFLLGYVLAVIYGVVLAYCLTFVIRIIIHGGL